MDHVGQFFSKLYTCDNPDINEIRRFMNHTKNPKTLTLQQQRECERKRKIEECEKVVRKLALNKSPGTDGLTAEFYQTFWSGISKFLMDVVNESFKAGYMGTSPREAVLTLIYKKGDRNKIKNYRPISLTNIDYKILAFTLFQRIKKVIPSIISDDQTAYVKSRYIGQNKRLIQDII